jgi:hypothetical protein
MRVEEVKKLALLGHKTSEHRFVSVVWQKAAFYHFEAPETLSRAGRSAPRRLANTPNIVQAH